MGIIENAREIADLIKKYNDQELYEKIVGLREEILKLREQNLALYEENASLKKERHTHERLVRDGNCYYLDDDPKRERPYCLTCWDHDRKLVSLILGRNRIGVTLRCCACESRKK